MTSDPMDSETRRVSDEIVARLRARGIEVSQQESPENLVRLLDAVEEFERTVQRRGGDLMVDEPVGLARPVDPDEASFVLPTRAEHESIAAFIERIGEARGKAARAHRRA